MNDPDKMSAEFGAVASWTAAAARTLGRSYYVPAGCRGSGGPAAMDWLLGRLPDVAGAPLLDVGAGIGGPAAFARERRNASVVLVEPELRACAAARSLFGFDPVCASAADLPFDSATFSIAWCLGVLCTIAHHEDALEELARVVAPHGRVGMLVYARTKRLDEQPEGNHFPELRSLNSLYESAGFDVVDEIALAELPPSPQPWSDRDSAVTDWIDARHRDEPTWRHSLTQESILRDLLGSEAVVGHLSTLIRREQCG